MKTVNLFLCVILDHLGCFDLIETGRGFDWLPYTRLEVQKIRLLIWGESAGLSRSSYSVKERGSLLRHQKIRAAVYRLLILARLLFDAGGMWAAEILRVCMNGLNSCF